MIFLTDDEIKKINISNDFEFAESFNKNHCVTHETKLIIVGTITPPAGAGYFYSAPRNRIYGYLDAFFKDTNLKELKKSLHINPENRNEIVSKIKEQLILKKVAFLDVIKFAIRKKDSYLDKDIKYCSLDFESFKISSNATIICNSKDAYNCFCEICKKLNIEPSKNIYLSQRFGTKIEWLKTFESILD